MKLNRLSIGLMLSGAVVFAWVTAVKAETGTREAVRAEEVEAQENPPYSPLRKVGLFHSQDKLDKLN
ncbi:MAG: hypothetical protein AAGE96_16820 [Cyanobacteria bacterium P01_G01_bin.19]